MKSFFFSVFAITISSLASRAQTPPATNYDETQVPSYILPDPLISTIGKPITTGKEWEAHQRPHILILFTDYVYGKVPGKPAGLHFKVTESDANALNGKATRKQVTIYFAEGDDAPFMDVLLYLPKTNHPVTVFTGLNFNGNHTIASDRAIKPARFFKKKADQTSLTDAEAIEASRGSSASRWPLEEIIGKGYGIATAHYYDLEPDHKDGWKTGIRTTMKDRLHISPEEWSAIGAWAWGLSRIEDYLETDPAVDAKKTILIGHSRLGKTSLWAGANDPRFAIVISNDSGEGGAALSRRIFGETIRNLNTSFPHWFIARYKHYNDHPEMLPVDQHMLLSLIAPRPLYVASAEDDKWADPKGEFLSAKAAGPVYRLYKLKGLTVKEMPPVNTPVGATIGYHIRTGKHDINLYDWQQYLLFAERHKSGK
ncbi:MAG: hypothetical protein M9933_07215 [Chitinophagaceae bacterium]|nr:hypothetical protein [Chitinophagaceae bacterium]